MYYTGTTCALIGGHGDLHGRIGYYIDVHIIGSEPAILNVSYIVHIHTHTATHINYTRRIDTCAGVHITQEG